MRVGKDVDLALTCSLFYNILFLNDGSFSLCKATIEFFFWCVQYFGAQEENEW